MSGGVRAVPFCAPARLHHVPCGRRHAVARLAPQVPVIDLTQPEDALAPLVHSACTGTGFFYGGLALRCAAHCAAATHGSARAHAHMLHVHTPTWCRHTPRASPALGLCAVCGHGVPEALLNTTFDVNRCLFRLPLVRGGACVRGVHGGRAQACSAVPQRVACATPVPYMAQAEKMALLADANNRGYTPMGEVIDARALSVVPALASRKRLVAMHARAHAGNAGPRTPEDGRHQGGM